MSDSDDPKNIISEAERDTLRGLTYMETQKNKILQKRETNKRLVKKANEFFLNDPKAYQKFCNINNGSNVDITLPMIDFFLKHGPSDVKKKYHDVLGEYGNDYFNIYQRKQGTPIDIKGIMTSVAQYNAFRWLFELGVFHRVERDCKTIKKNMIEFYKPK